jgi:hypothetical protein
MSNEYLHGDLFEVTISNVTEEELDELRTYFGNDVTATQVREAEPAPTTPAEPVEPVESDPGKVPVIDRTKSALANIFAWVKPGDKPYVPPGPDKDHPDYIPPSVRRNPGSIISTHRGAAIVPKKFEPPFTNETTTINFVEVGSPWAYGVADVHSGGGVKLPGVIGGKPWQVNIGSGPVRSIGTTGRIFRSYNAGEAGKLDTLVVKDSYDNTTMVEFVVPGEGTIAFVFADAGNTRQVSCSWNPVR